MLVMLLVQPLGDLGVGGVDDLVHLGPEGLPLLPEVDGHAPAVLLVVDPVDQALLLQPAQHAGDGGGVQPQGLGQLGGREPVLRVEALEQRVLGRGDIILLQLPFEIVMDRVLRVGEDEVDAAVDLHGEISSSFQIEYPKLYQRKSNIVKEIRAKKQGRNGPCKSCQKSLDKPKKKYIKCIDNALSSGYNEMQQIVCRQNTCCPNATSV